jgi:hypothetical protein
MKILAIVTVIAVAFAPLQAANSSCRALTIPNEIELPAGELVLADLFPPSACSQVLHAARQIHLGSVPLTGSPRVFSGNEVRALLRKLDDKEGPSTEFLTVPERITVRRKGGQKLAAASRSVRSSISPLPAASRTSADEAVRPGQTVMLLWDQGGIRLQVPALCLDRGAPGSEVRARILRSRTVVRATVVSAGSLRTIS